MKEGQSRLLWSGHFESILAALLMLVLAAELGFSVRRQSQTFDEVDHIHAGYRYWQCGDFGVNPEHPPLAKLVATLPLVFDWPKNPGPPCASYDTGWRADNAHGIDFLYSNDARKILAQTRFFAASFTLLLAAFVFVATRQMFGGGAALLALLLLVFEPTILAHGALVTTDLAVTCWVFAAVYTFYRFQERPTTLRAILCGLAAGLALAAKHSALLLLPILVLLAYADGNIRSRTSAPADSHAPRGQWKQQPLRRVPGLAIVAVAICTVWGLYFFHYSARPAGHEMTDPISAHIRHIQDVIRNGSVHSALLARLIPGLARALPESYLRGVGRISVASRAGRPTFLLGHLYPTGRWFYFPVAFVIKSTLGFQFLLILFILAGGYLWREKKRATVFLTVPAALFFGLSLASHLNIGIRHILPVYPFLIVLAAAAAWQLARQKRALAYTVVALVTFHCLSSLRAFPDYLSYSNEAWGGPLETYRYLTDSNVDWGRGFIDDKNYLVHNGITDCWIADYSATADPDYYGIPCKILGPYKQFAVVPRPVEGTLVISTTDLSGLPWGPPELNPYGPLWHVKPVANLGGHTLVFQGRFDLPLLSAVSHSRQAEILASRGRLDEALREARTGVGMAPGRMQSHLTLAQVLAQAKQFPEAGAEYLEAIRLAETGETGYYRLLIFAARQELAALDSSR